MIYDCIIVGGGVAGLQAAIQLGRYKHDVLVIDAGYGRSTLCRCYHNILGWPKGVSGSELRRLGTIHAKQYGVTFTNDEIVAAKKIRAGFKCIGKTKNMYRAKRLLLSTGLRDRLPTIPHMVECLGQSIYVCPDCDGYEAADKEVIVLGSGNSGAAMSLRLTYFTKSIRYVNHDQQPIKHSLRERLKKENIQEIPLEIKRVLISKPGTFTGVELVDGSKLEGDRAFVSFGNNDVRSDVAKQLGAERLENKHLVVDSRTKMTSVPNVWAAGDIVAHSELLAIAMGDGSQAAIWIHKSLIK